MQGQARCLSYFVAKSAQFGIALLVAVLLAVLLPTEAAHAVELEFHLVPYDQLDATVDSREKQQPILNPVQTDKGVQMQRIGLNIVCWARNVLLDDQPLFERYHEGKYIDRLPKAKKELAPGRHVIWPGNHAFTIAADGKVTLDSPDLTQQGSVIRIKAYPVTVRAYLANPDQGDLPAVMRESPLPDITVREAGEAAAIEQAQAAARQKGQQPPDGKARELLPVFDKFAPLTIWLPANRAGQGYALFPMGLTFQLSEAGITAAAGGGPAPMPGIQIDKWEIRIPLYSFPFTGNDKCSVIVSGVSSLAWLPYQDGQTKSTALYPRRQGYEIRVSEVGPALHVDGDLAARPVKTFRADIPDPAAAIQRGLVAELPRRHFQPGESVTVRIDAVDPGVPPSFRGGPDSGTLSNRLADAIPFAQAQLYGATNWTTVAIQPSTNGLATLTIPALGDGVYTLRLGVQPKGDTQPPIAADAWVTVAQPHESSVGLFTPRGRDAFYRGESFWVGVGLLGIGKPIAAGTPLQVALVDDADRRFVLLQEKVKNAVKDRTTRVLQLAGATTLQLAPGRYRLEATLGQVAARPRVIDIVEPELKTHFSNVLIGKYSPYGLRYAAITRGSPGAEALARELTDQGLNGFMGMCYDMDRIAHPDAIIEQVVRERPELGPWEAYEQASGRDRFLNACVRHNLRFWENLFTYNDTSLPRGDAILAAAARYAGLEVASMQHSPAFQGACLYDEIYSRSLIDGVPVVTAFEHAMELGYRAKHPELTSGKAMKALDRYAGRPLEQRNVKDLEMFRTYPAYEDECWRLWCDAVTGAIKTVMPRSRNFVLNRYWGGNGGNISANGREEDVYANVEIAANVMYKDGGYGERPVYPPMQADVMRVAGKRDIWTQLHNAGGPSVYGPHLLREAFFALSRPIDGFTFFHATFDRDAIENIAGNLTTRYGDFFLSLDKGYKGVAIYYPQVAKYLQLRKPNSLNHQAEGLWVACIRAGFPAVFLRDEDIAAGRAMEYHALFAPGFVYEDECPPKILAELRRFANAGKPLLVERSSRLPVEGAVRLPSELDEYDPKINISPKYLDGETEAVFDQTEEMTKLVRETLAKRIAPAARHNLLVGPDWLQHGDGQYLVIPNFNPAVFTGLYKTLYQAPDRPRLEFPKRPPVCYDVLEMKPQAVTSTGEWMAADLDMSRYPGKLLAFLPEAIGSVRLETSPTLAAGSALTYRVAVLNAQGKPINASFPIEIQITDPAGRRQLEVYRAAAPELTAAYAVPVNLPPGNWTITVRELISGTTATSTVAVTAGAALSATIDARPARLENPKKLAQFLENKSTEILVPLEPEQQWLKPVADKLCAALTQRGLQARIVDCDKTVRPPGDWNVDKPVLDGTRLWRGDVVQPGFFVDKPVILLGRRGENRLIEALIGRDALAAPLTPHFPAPGSALVAWTHAAFGNRADAISILANDSEGLVAGVDALLNLKPDTAGDMPAPLLATAQPDASRLTAATAGNKQPVSFADTINGEDQVQCLDLDAKTGRVLVGTFGYGENLFCFDADGKLLWKTYLPEHDVYFARWYDDGQRVVAATGRGWYAFLLNGSDGRVFKKFSATEWPDTHWSEGAINTRVEITLNPALRQILIAGRTGLLAVDFDGKRQWFADRTPEIVAIVQTTDKSADAAAFPITGKLGNVAVSPDGQRLVAGEYQVVGTMIHGFDTHYIYAFRPRFLEAATGKITAVSTNDPGNQTGTSGWIVRWPSDSKTPWVDAFGLTAPFNDDGALGSWRALPGRPLQDGSYLQIRTNETRRVDARGQALWQISNGPDLYPVIAAVAPDQTCFYRSSWRGEISCVNMADGAVRWSVPAPYRSLLTPVADGVLAGTIDGNVLRLDRDGKVRWQSCVRKLHEPPVGDYAAYVRAGLDRDVDSTGDYFPIGLDKPGEYDQVLRFGMEQLANPGFEEDAAWTVAGKAPTFATTAHQGKRALQLQPGATVTQALDRRVVPLGTYILEFFYQPTVTGAVLTAGAQLQGEADSFTLSTFRGRPGEWNFARLAIKSRLTTKNLTIGWEASGGPILVDDVSLKPVRFPSANLLAQLELHAIEPTFVRDTRVNYNRIPADLKQKLLSQNHVTAFKQSLTENAVPFIEEESFLQNGRIDDTGLNWYYSSDGIGYSAVLTKAAWISHVVLYLNNARPDVVYRTLAIEANNVETKNVDVVHLVRNNQRRFLVVHFPKPIFTDCIKILPGQQIRAHNDSLTEIEFYGPVGGPETAGISGFPADPLGWPMFMGSPAHVPTNPPADLVGTYIAAHQSQNPTPAFFTAAIAATNRLIVGSADGMLRSAPILPGEKGRPEWNGSWTTGSVTPVSTPAWYAGRLLVGAADDKLHAVAEDGTKLWSFPTGGRVYSAPTPAGHDVFFGSDDGNLYRVDIDSGILLWEFKTNGKIRGSPALADGKLFVASGDGFLYAVTAETGKPIWKSPLAPYTRSAAAVANGAVFIGDESGHMRSFQAADGKAGFDLPLGGRIGHCPLVTTNGVFFNSEQGHIALVGSDGQARWNRKLDTDITGQPIATQSQLLIPTPRGLVVLQQATGQPDERIKLPPQSGRLIAALPYGDRLCLVTAGAFTQFYAGMPYAKYYSQITIMTPEEKK